MIGQTLGHYRILEKLGEGGMGVVYRARDERLERDVAIKVLPPGTLTDEAARKRFRKEALSLSRLNHPNIATIFDFDTQDGVDFLVMEFIAGDPLDKKLASGPLPEKEVVRLGRQLAEGLAAAHEQGVVNRDLKPANLRLTPDGRLKILDFGLAKLLQPASDEVVTADSFTESRPRLAGTLPYMAPEQLRAEKVDARADIYAAGAVLYELATGQRPFPETREPQLIDAILNRAPAPPRQLNARLSAGLESLVLKALDKEPDRRYQTARDLRADLERLTVTVSGVAAAQPRRFARRWLFTAAGLLAVLLAMLLGLNVGGLWQRVLREPATPQIESLAVLPLKNLSGDLEQAYFVEGMHEALITELSKISALKVISRTSAMRYKQTDKPLPQVARELNVDAVIEGSVLREGHQVRITVQLIHGPTDRHLWAQSFDRELRGILALHSDVARAIAGEIKLTLTPHEQTRLASARPVDSEAYEAYLRGRYHSNKGTEEGFRKAVEHFQQAIEKDPTYALAYAGLADCYNVFPLYAGVAPKDAFPKAKTAVAKALEIDETLAEAHTSLAWGKLVYDWNWASAEEEFKRALELNPSYEKVHFWYGLQLTWGGKPDQGLAEVKRAQKLDPLSEPINTFVGVFFYLDRQYDKAIQQLKEARDLHSNSPRPHAWLGLTYVQKGMYREAIAALENSVELEKRQRSIPLGRLGYAYAKAGQRSQALGVIEQLKALSKRKYVPASDFALVYLGLEEKDQTFLWLEKAYEERATELMFLKADPRFDPLRSEPRFQDLLRRMNFPK